MAKVAKWAAALLASGLLGGCVVADSFDYAGIDPGPVPEYEAAKVQAQDAIKGVLKDPDSAQFRTFTPFFKMRYAYGMGGSDEVLWTMCVDVNAKNEFGGYGGFETFVVKFRNGQVVSDVNGLFRSELTDYCVSAPADPARRAPVDG
jgi:hypothetical protein